MHHFILGSLRALLFQLLSTKIYRIPFGYEPRTETCKLYSSCLYSVRIGKSHGILWGFILPGDMILLKGVERCCLFILFRQYLFGVIKQSNREIKFAATLSFFGFHSYLLSGEWKILILWWLEPTGHLSIHKTFKALRGHALIFGLCLFWKLNSGLQYKLESEIQLVQFSGFLYIH